MTQPNRRDFMKSAAVTGAGFWLLAGTESKLSASPNERVAFAGIGIGGKGHGDIGNAAKYCDIVAVCDTDRNTLKAGLGRFPGSQGFTDYREMLDKMGDKIDAMNISTADHTHACAALMAMRMKKHCYVQKPLSRTIYEARLMGKVAKETGVCTQMGNQGSAGDGLRRGAARLKAGIDGVVKEVHVWTDRPIWPQGFEVVRDMETYEKNLRKENKSDDDLEKELANMKKRIENDLKNNIDWESWIGPGKFRDYFPGAFHGFNWRGFWEFGTGALGDIACHSLNKHMAGLDLSAPRSVIATTSGHDFDTFPSWSIIEYEYPANEERPGFKFVWYDGGKRPDAALLDKYGIAHDAKGGEIIVYEEGTKKDKPMPEVRLAPKHPDHPDDDSRNMYELITAIKENKPELCFSNFPNQAGPLTEAMLLGNLAVWTAFEPEKHGEKIEWNAGKMEVTNLASIKTPGTAELVKPKYRDGYRLD